MNVNQVIHTLREQERDIFVDYYLGHIVQNNEKLKNIIKTVDDLYELLLIDNQVTAKVSTTRLAQAIASYQQFINSVYQHANSGYITTANDEKKWDQYLSRFAIWEANQMLRNYPENYIDPTLRLGKTKFFNELEMKLNQGRINQDAAESAVLSYLNSFEEVANLRIISGYEHKVTNDSTNSICFLVGCTRLKPYQYYWRSVDLSNRNGAKGVLFPTAWSEWKKIDLPLSENTLEDTVRPVFMNNRLYMVWVNIKKKIITSLSTAIFNNDQNMDANEKEVSTLEMYIVHKKFDNSWSAPHLLFEEELKVKSPPNRLIAVIDEITNKDESLLVLIAFNSNNPTNNFYYICDSFLIAKDNISLSYLQIMTSAFKNSEYVQRPFSSPKFFINKIEKKEEYFKGKANDSINLEASITSNQQIKLLLVSSYKREENIQTLILGGANVDQLYRNKSGNIQEQRVVFTISLSGEAIINDSNKTFSYKGLATITHRTTVKPHLYNKEFKCYYKGNLLFSLAVGQATGSQASHHIEFSGSYTDVKDLEKHWDYYYTATNSGNSPTTIGPYAGNSNRLMNSDNDIGPLNGNYGIWIFENNNLKELVTHNQNMDGSQKLLYENFPIINNQLQYNFVVGFDEDAKAGAVKYQINIEAQDVENPLQIITTPNKAQYLDITPLNFDYKSIRLNTLFGKELISKAHVSIDSVLNWQTQLIKEPEIPFPYASDFFVDFHGANGLYFWELFFHLPFLVAWRMNQEQRYKECAKWLHYIFNPYDNESDEDPANLLNNKPSYWSVRPLEEKNSYQQDSSKSYRLLRPADPDAIAASNPIHYKKAIYQFYILNMRDRGDSAFRELTPDSLTSAKLWYIAAKELLGPRPKINYTSQSVPIKINDAINSVSAKIRDYEEFAVEQYNVITPVTRDESLRNTDTDYFLTALNIKLIQQWDELDDRLFKLRNNLDLNGQPLFLPFFAPRIDPKELMINRLNSEGNEVTGAMHIIVNAPPYRYPIIFNKAQQAVESLIQYGNNLLNILERKDNIFNEDLQLKQQNLLFNFIEDLEKISIESAKKSLEGLKINKNAIRLRHDHYKKLYDENISVSEWSALALRTTAQVIQTGTTPLHATASAIDALPTIFGLANGGAKPSALPRGVAVGLQIAADSMNLGAMWIETTENYRRRRQEWEIQYRLAKEDLLQIDKQIEQQNLQIAYNKKQLEYLNLQQQNLRDTYTFLSTRFTNQQLYQWLLGQLSALYYQSYDCTVSICLLAEAAWRIEIGEFSSNFVKGGNWEDRYRGLLAGEKLKLALLRMDQAYLTRYERRLEITKTISLKHLVATDEFGFNQKIWDEYIVRLKETGNIQFNLKNKIFEEDYPGHYLRQITNLTVSLPAVMAPYQDICATLIQLDNIILTKPDIEGFKYLLDPSKPCNSEYIKRNLRANQQISLSTGMEDSGMFILTFSNERYLPFEGTGIVSQWELHFPNPQSKKQQLILNSLTDIIIRINYTAKNGGEIFKQKVLEILNADNN